LNLLREKYFLDKTFGAPGGIRTVFGARIGYKNYAGSNPHGYKLAHAITVAEIGFKIV